MGKIEGLRPPYKVELASKRKEHLAFLASLISIEEMISFKDTDLREKLSGIIAHYISSNPNDRRAEVYQLGLDFDLLNHIDYSGSSVEFSRRLITFLIRSFRLLIVLRGLHGWIERSDSTS